MMNLQEERERQAVLKKAIIEIRNMRTELEALEQARTEPIAIIGMGCRFPGGANSPNAFWRLLHSGTDAVIEVPAGRWDANAFYDSSPAAQGKMYTRHGGFLQEDLSLFDAEFFRISPREATSLDPQQRLLLEVAWEALESAGHAVSMADGGVFIGISTNDYAQFAMFGDPQQIDVYSATGNALSAAAGRLAFSLGFRGPALAVDTACSSSLVAVHLACQSLHAHECRLALAGGVSLILTPHGTIATCRARMMAADGRCKTFDVRADGYGRGEGCVVVALKRLSDAVADQDPILALILGSAVNQDGASSALTVPNGEAQRALMRSAMATARVLPAAYSYLEAHGTGTPLGDPIEFDAIRSVLSEGRQSGQVCAMGSVKTNIGHLEAAAGAAGLIKVVLAMQHEEIPPHLHLQQVNPHIVLEGTPFTIPVSPHPWPRAATPRVAGVNSFGFTGTNAHVVLQEAPKSQPRPEQVDRPVHLLTLSARTEEALAALAARYTVHLTAHPEQTPGDVGFTVHTGRTAFGQRLALVGTSSAQWAARLTSWQPMRQTAGVWHGVVPRGQRPKVAFLCSGQGAQFAGMGRQLYEQHPLFRHTLEQCQEILRDRLPLPLLEVLYGAAGSLLDETRYTQPVVFALGYALGQVWRSWGVEPTVMLGHSVGEYVAACLAGVFSLEDGLRLLGRRAELMQALTEPGQMAAVEAGAAQVQAVLQGREQWVSIAALNGPQQTVIAGARIVVEEMLHELTAAGVPWQPLRVSHAFHSPLMDGMLEEFAAAAQEVSYAVPRRRVISTLSGQVVEGAAMSQAEYWRRQVRQPVAFYQAMQTLREQGCEVLLEIGPGTTLLRLGQACVPEQAGVWLASLRRGRGDWEQLLESLGQWWVRGGEVDWHGFDRGYPRRRVVLPTYPFQRQHYWIEGTGDTHRSTLIPAVDTGHAFLGRQIFSPLEHLQFETIFDLHTVPIVGDHRIYGTAWVNLVVYLEMGLAAGAAAFGSGPAAVRDLEIEHPLILPERGGRTVQLILTQTGDAQGQFQIFSLKPGSALQHAGHGASAGFIRHARGTVERLTAWPVTGRILSSELVNRCTRQLSASEFYTATFSDAIHFGPRCRRVETVWIGCDEAVSDIRPSRNPEVVEPHTILDLSVTDSCFQLLAALLPADSPRGHLISGLRSFAYYGQPSGTRVFCHAQVESFETDTGRLTSHLSLYDAQGELLLEAIGARLERVVAPVQAETAYDSHSNAGRVANPKLLISELLELEAPQRDTKLLEYVVAELASATGFPAEKIDVDAALLNQLDSLIAVEMKTRIEMELGIPVPVAAFFDGSSPRQLALLLLDAVLNGQAVVSSEAADMLTDLLNEIDTLSEEQAKAIAARQGESGESI